MKYFFNFLLLLVFVYGNSQSSYCGYLGEYPITLVVYQYSDGMTRAHYVYDRYDMPMAVNGQMNEGNLDLFEKDVLDKTSAILHFPNVFSFSINKL